MTTNSQPVDYQKALPEVFTMLGQVYPMLNRLDFDRTISHLASLRVSQINGCVYCIDMHTREARADGETDTRLDRLVAWHWADDYSPQERAALAWAEALTILDRQTNYGMLRAELRRYFSEHEISVLTVVITMINHWNRIRVSNH